MASSLPGYRQLSAFAMLGVCGSLAFVFILLIVIGQGAVFLRLVGAAGGTAGQPLMLALAHFFLFGAQVLGFDGEATVERWLGLASDGPWALPVA